MNLSELLQRVPGVYADLEHAHAVKVGEPSEPIKGDGPSSRPPGRLEVIEHRHKLVKILRWWVDAIRDELPAEPVGDSVPRMCLFLVANLPHIVAADQGALKDQLSWWRRNAWKIMDPAPMTADEKIRWMLPEETELRIVPVHVAAELLGVSRMTIRRRVPAEKRPAGKVKVLEALTEADLCKHSLWDRTCTLCA